MSEYENYQWNQNGNQPIYQPDGGKHHDNSNMKKAAKKIGAIALSAVLFGGIAGGVFTGVTYATGATAKRAETQMADSSAVNEITEKNAEEKSATLQTAVPSDDGAVNSQSLDVSDIAEGAMPSIVAITNKSVQEVQSYFSMFGRRSSVQEQEVESQGSGIIIGQNEEELLIATNNHVVEDADTLSACFIDDQVYEAAVKGTDAENDLAVIAVKLSDISEDTMSKIKIAEIGDSDSLKVGQQVVAIGNALGYGQSVTTGIVSAVNRQVGDSESENGFIQTDAAINPGNSGGALLNMQGELIGINSAKLASTEVEGMGYAIPVSTASPIIEELMTRTTRAKVSEDQASAIGISGQTVDSNTSKTYGIPQGVYVAEVNGGSAAEKAGIQVGSIITKFDGTSIESIEDLKNQLTYYAAGETVEMTVKVANNGEYVEKTVVITLDKAQSEQQESIIK
ncbi:MAG: S1C family serine protease [Oliverpabstia sp.]